MSFTMKSHSSQSSYSRHSSLCSSLSSKDSTLPTLDLTDYDYSDGSESSSSLDCDGSTDFTPIAIASNKQSSIEAPRLFDDDNEDDYNNSHHTFSHDIPLSRGKKNSSFNIFSALAFCCMAMAMYYLGARSDHAATSAQLSEAEAARNELVQNQERLLVQLAKGRRLPTENNDLFHHVSLLQEDLEHATADLHAEEARRKEMETEAKAAWAEYEQVTTELSDVEVQMQDDASKMYQTLAMERFGPGPHYAEFQVQIWDNNQAETRYFTVETAPLEHMPASVFLFLQQVDNGLWDGSSFHINAPHVLLAQPITTDADAEEQPFDKMERMGLARVPFEEYNEDYTHTAYTLGYGGSKLPGPNFYINKVDNTNHHEGQPCFSKVIIGTDTIDRMGELQGANVENPYYIQPIDIVRVRLVHDLSEAHGGSTSYLNNNNSHHDEH